MKNFRNKLKKNNMKTLNQKIKKIALALLFIVPIATYAQPEKPPPPPEKPRKAERREEHKEDIESMRIAFLTTKLNLTPDEAKVFWPVYNQYSDKLQEVRKKRREDIKDTKQNFDSMSDKDVESSIDNNFSLRQKELDIQKEFNEKFKKVLPMKKVAKLYAAEEQFKMELLKKLQERQHPKEPRQPKEPRD
jgi:hypothetical protein